MPLILALFVLFTMGFFAPTPSPTPGPVYHFTEVYEDGSAVVYRQQGTDAREVGTKPSGTYSATGTVHICGDSPEADNTDAVCGEVN